jgi:hypothetical protein
MMQDVIPVGRVIPLDEVVVWELAARVTAATMINGLKIIVSLVASPTELAGAAYKVPSWEGKKGTPYMMLPTATCGHITSYEPFRSKIQNQTITRKPHGLEGRKLESSRWTALDASPLPYHPSGHVFFPRAPGVHSGYQQGSDSDK